MASAPDKPKASASEKQLTRQSIQQINEANRIQGLVQGDFLARSKKDRSKQLLNKINADNAQMMEKVRENGGGNITALVKNIGDAQRTLSGAKNSARANALAELDTNRLNAVRAGKGMQQTAMSGVNALAQIESSEMKQKMARDAQKNADMVGAITSLAMVGADQYMNQEGIFAKEKPAPTKNAGTALSSWENMIKFSKI